MTMKQWLLKRIKKLFENTESTITTVIVLALLGGSAGILALSKKALTFFLQISNISTPLWATISLILLCCLYTYLKASKYSKKNLPLDTSLANAILIEIGNFKWNVTILEDNKFEIHPIPYCKVHETRFVPFKEVYICPAYQLGCGSIIKKIDLKLQYDVAYSFIEHKIKNKCQQDVPADG